MDYAIFMLDPAGHVASWNPGAERIYGYTAEEILGQPHSRFFPGDDIASGKPEWELQSVLEAGRCEYECQCVRRDGSLFWAVVTVTNLKDHFGQHVGFSKVTRDITERKQSEAALHENEQRIRTLLENSWDGIGVVRRDGTIGYISSSGANMLGRTPLELLGKNGFDLVHPEDLDFVRQAVQAVAEMPGSHRTFQCRLRHRDGRDIWVESKFVNLIDNPVVGGIVSNFRDVSASKRAEVALQFERDRFETIVRTVPGVITAFQLFPDGRSCCPYASPAFEEFAGISPDEVAEDASPLLNMIHPEDCELVRQAIAESARHLSPFRMEYRARHPSKGEVWVETRSIPLAQPDGSVLWYGITTDITERKVMERTLKDSEERLCTALEAARMGSWVWDIQENKSAWNAQEYLLLGLPPKEGDADTEEFFRHVHPDDLPALRQQLAEVLDHGTEFQGEFRIVRADGATRWLAGRGRLFRDERTGKPLKMFGVNFDITEQKEAAERIAASERRFRALVENSWEGVILTDADGQPQYVSPAITRLLGYTPEEFRGRTPGDNIHPDDLPGLAPELRRILTTPGSRATLTYRVPHKDGSWRWVEVAATNMMSEANVAAIVFNYHDITERKEHADLAAFNADVGLALSTSLSIQPMLQQCAEAMVRHLHGAFARIWTLNPAQNMLELRASAGLYTHLDGPHSRVPSASSRSA